MNSLIVFFVQVVLCRKSLFKLRFSGQILRASRTGMEVTKAFLVLHDLLVTSPGSARLHVVVHPSASTHAQFLTGMHWEWNVV